MGTRMDLTLNSDNAAFADNAGAEVARILRALADSIEAGAEGHFRLMDVNGNGAGAAFLEVWPEEE